MSAVTPDLCRPMYGDKIVGFLDQLMDPRFAGKPFMRHYLDYYFDIYWDLHLGVKDDAIPPMVWTIGESFNTVLAFRDPMRIIDEVKARRIGFPRCPFDLTTFDVSDARKAGPADSGFGTVLGVVDGKPLPISGRSGARRPERR